MGAEMLGKQVDWRPDGAPPVVGVVKAGQPRELLDVTTGVTRPAVRFQIETTDGRLVWTDAMAAA